MRTRTRPGHLLLEAMLAIALLAVFTYAEALLFNSILETTRQAKRVPREDRARRPPLEQLRADVWRAESIEVNSESELSLRLPAGRTAVWRIFPMGTIPGQPAQLARSESTGSGGAANPVWDVQGGPAPKSFHAHPPGVRILWPEGAPDRGVVDLYSQAHMLTGDGP